MHPSPDVYACLGRSSHHIDVADQRIVCVEHIEIDDGALNKLSALVCTSVSTVHGDHRAAIAMLQINKLAVEFGCQAAGVLLNRRHASNSLQGLKAVPERGDP
mmetsp:Transcript_69391/g.162498  ORF Transcript_69391/g.162498 Transcript_69391/m.162498 type:complete len:103 (-) Transcript_69391:996-1304(-)